MLSTSGTFQTFCLLRVLSLWSPVRHFDYEVNETQTRLKFRLNECLLSIQLKEDSLSVDVSLLYGGTSSSLFLRSRVTWERTY